MPGSINIHDLIGAYSAADFDIPNDDTRDAGAMLTRALAYIAAQNLPNGRLEFGPGTYRILTPVSLISDLEIVGAGSVTEFKLGPSAYSEMFRGESLTNVRYSNFRVNGNRANNSPSSGIANGITLRNVTDGLLDNVEVTGVTGDGVWLDQCERVEVRGGRANDNGRHGYALTATSFCLFMAPRAYNNSRVSSSGTGDGINLDLLSHDNLIAFPLAYESALTGGRQGYGVREASGSGCYRNFAILNPQANATGAFYMEPDSLAMSVDRLLTGGAFGINTSSPSASALLDLTSTTKGLLLPRMTTAQKSGVSSPTTGLVVFDTDLAKLAVWTGAAWEAVTSG